MATYERRSGEHVAESVRPEPGSEAEAAYAALADDPASGWRLVDAQAPKKSRAKAGEG
ncbi:hypothetical protein [Streptomyces sp. NPDC002467]|uniref:hypothetical protein n=1 Tax=Streptomyces sp. NPDC002467 TaxID=3364647 RepID=UPI0036AD6CE2